MKMNTTTHTKYIFWWNFNGNLWKAEEIIFPTSQCWSSTKLQWKLNQKPEQKKSEERMKKKKKSASKIDKDARISNTHRHNIIEIYIEAGKTLQLFNDVFNFKHNGHIIIFEAFMILITFWYNKQPKWKQNRIDFESVGCSTWISDKYFRGKKMATLMYS